MEYRPWAKVGTDLFSFHGKDYLITVDYYSNFWEVDYLPDTTSVTVIRKLKAHFARQGIPDIVVSDNGPQYTSQEFKRFSRLWEFKHRTSSPGYAQSNGKAESAVKTAKALMRKAAMDERDPYLAILDHRNTPSQGLATSPAQRLLNRRTRTLLPTKDTLLEPELQNNEQGIRQNQYRQEKYYNRTAKNLNALRSGDKVRVQPLDPHGVWKPARVVRPVDNRSYEVKLESGGVLRRNRRHLRQESDAASIISTRNETQRTALCEVTTQHCDTEDRTKIVTRSGRQVNKPKYLEDYTQ